MALPAHWLLFADPENPAPPLPEIPDGLEGVLTPNPGETYWTLGVGGVSTSPRVRAGWDLILATALFNNGVPCSYAVEPYLEAVVWRGDDAANLFFPEATWISSPDGTLQLVIRGADTVGLEPGRYSLRVGLTVAGIRLLAYDGALEVEAAPGSDIPRVPYVTGRDVAFYYDQVGGFQGESDETNFVAQRVDASDEFDRMIVERYMARPGFTRLRSPTYDRHFGYDIPTTAIDPPTKAQLTGWLAQGGLVVEQKAREMVARMALSIVLDRQETDGQNVYRQHGQTQRERVAELWRAYEAQIDADADGTPDWLISIDATSLPAGAAP